MSLLSLNTAKSVSKWPSRAAWKESATTNGPDKYDLLLRVGVIARSLSGTKFTVSDGIIGYLQMLRSVKLVFAKVSGIVYDRRRDT